MPPWKEALLALALAAVATAMMGLALYLLTLVK
jgi:hypothetical protein